MGEMLNDLIFSVNTILPVFIVVAIGYYMRRKGTVDASFVSSTSNVVFYYALPARMFLDVAGSDFTELMNPRFYPCDSRRNHRHFSFSVAGNQSLYS